jgi:hypothetical protein
MGGSTVVWGFSFLFLYVKGSLKIKQMFTSVFILRNEYFWEPGSSVSIVTAYGLVDWVIAVQSSAEGKGFFL